jgi:hypothetical protein
MDRRKVLQFQWKLPMQGIYQIMSEVGAKDKFGTILRLGYLIYHYQERWEPIVGKGVDKQYMAVSTDLRYLAFAIPDLR